MTHFLFEPGVLNGRRPIAPLDVVVDVDDQALVGSPERGSPQSSTDHLLVKDVTDGRPCDHDAPDGGGVEARREHSVVTEHGQFALAELFDRGSTSRRTHRICERSSRDRLHVRSGLDEALEEVTGAPVPAAQGPRLDPGKVEEFKSTARRLMAQQGVPADQIEQRLNDMVANAQQPIVPYTPPDVQAPPKPGFGEGFGDAWRSAEESAHDLTGQNGWDSFKEAWKDLGGGLAETVVDPYGTAARSVAEDAEALRNNPEYWLGGKTFEVGAAAATLPFGAEGAAAARLSALDDVARSGIPHEVIDAPSSAHNPTTLPVPQETVPPVAPHTPSIGEIQGPLRGTDHPVVPTPDGFDYQDVVGPQLPESITDIQQWLPEINHGRGMDPFDPARAVNCGQCALAVDQRLTGAVPDASAGLGTLSIPEMEAATGLRQAPATPAEIEQYLVSQGPGAHTVIGVDRANGFAGHWFNAYYDGSRVYAVDGQTGQILGWPPNMDFPNAPVTAWDMGVPK